MFLSNGQSLSRLHKNAKQQAKLNSIKLHEAQALIAKEQGYTSWANMIKISNLHPTLKLSLPDKSPVEMLESGGSVPPTFLLQTNRARIGYILGRTGSGKTITALDFAEQALSQDWEVFVLGSWSVNEKAFRHDLSEARGIQLLKHERFHPVDTLSLGERIIDISNLSPKTLFICDEAHHLLNGRSDVITTILKTGFPTIFVIRDYLDLPETGVLPDFLMDDSGTPAENDKHGFTLTHSPDMLEDWNDKPSGDELNLKTAITIMNELGANFGATKDGVSLFGRPECSEKEIMRYCDEMGETERSDLLLKRVLSLKPAT
ncbi:MAG: ATP-binding protein [Moritella sp.]|uniref:ATP-binding protein n=1 Tax=Moritella sp. TaxID=78556 RepID=UPI001D4C7EBB|nr:ATP-binding protein [Moritella sp.]NQZ49298.1 ATP-binding protein [Moritella sp.]